MNTKRTFINLIAIPCLALWLIPAEASGQARLEETFEVKTESEGLLDLTAVSPGASWAEKGNEAAVATIYLDGRYHQDLILFGGPVAFTYKVMLGRLGPGSHSLRVEHNTRLSAPRCAAPQFGGARISTVTPSDFEYQVLAMAPILYARRNTIGRFSDVPVLSWYEILQEGADKIIRYSVIFTNEDGGTQTNALMARWGRTTDIELIYEARLNAQGRLLSEIFQGKSHKNLRFRGKKEADHPLYLVATDNDMFSDKGQSSMRFALRPVLVNLSRASREEVMHQYPWTYRLASEELVREGKLDESVRVGQKIADPRRYLYIQAGGKLTSTAMSFAVRLQGDPNWYTSDIGIGYYKIDRNGYFQTTVRLPEGVTLDRIERIAVRCDVAGDPRSWEEMSKAASAQCELNAVNRVFMLDERYQPGMQLPLPVPPLKMQFGDMVEFYPYRQ